MENQLLTINEKAKIVAHKIQHVTEIVLPNRSTSSDHNTDDSNDLLTVSLESIEQINGIIYKNVHLLNGEQQEQWKKKTDEQENLLNKCKIENQALVTQSNETQNLFHKTHEHLVRKNIFNSIFAHRHRSNF